MTPATIDVHFDCQGRGGRKHLVASPAPRLPPPGRIPRVARLMALAIRFDGLVRTGALESFANLARLGHVRRARMSQIMSLLNLAPDIQEALLFLPPETGRPWLVLRDLLPITREADWGRQRAMWGKTPGAICRIEGFSTHDLSPSSKREGSKAETFLRP